VSRRQPKLQRHRAQCRRTDDLHVLHVRRVSFRRLPNSFSCSLSRAVSFPTPRAGRHKKSLARRLRWSGRRIYDRASSLMLRLRRGRLSTNIKKTEISRVVVRDSTHTTIRRVARERERERSVQPYQPTGFMDSVARFVFCLFCDRIGAKRKSMPKNGFRLSFEPKSTHSSHSNTQGDSDDVIIVSYLCQLISVAIL